MNSKILFVIIALIIVFGSFTFLGNKKASPVPEQQPQSTGILTEPTLAKKEEIVKVILTDAGFTPKEITVKIGTRTAWINNSGKAATVSSDPHPTHTNYSPLNLGEFADKSSVQLVFDKKGTYGYHNHYNASEKGTVIVE